MLLVLISCVNCLMTALNVSRSTEVMMDMVKILSKQRNGLNVCHINAQSLKNKIDELRLTFENSLVDVICISESWFDDAIPDSLVSLNGYKLFRADRKKRGGGVAIYVKMNINCKLVARNEESNKIEFLFIEISAKDRKLLLGSVYRPHRSIPFDNFIRQIEVMTATYSDVIIAGDFNSNLLVDQSLKENMYSFGLKVVNNVLPTHFTTSCNTLLDLFIVNDTSEILLYDQISAPCFSKHDLIFLSYNFKPNIETQTLMYRDYKNLDYEALRENINYIDWCRVYNMVSVDEKVDFVEGNIIKLYDIAVPLRTRILNPQSRPWFNSNIKALIRKRDFAHGRWKRFKSTDLQQEFKTARREVNCAIRRAKFEYYAKCFSKSIGSRAMWNNIKKIGVCCKEMSDVSVDVNELNRSFVNAPIVSANTDFYEFSDTDDSCDAFEFSCVSQNDVLLSFSAVRSNATGCDDINPKFVRLILPQIISIITHLFNFIITSSNFPERWRHSKIVPIPKSKTEYRPIAILPYLSKVFEKVLHYQMCSYIESSALLAENQSGFRAKHSCVTTLTDVVEDLRLSIDDKRVNVLVLLDHSKAFDTIDHDMLGFKLGHFFNFSRTSVSLIKSYLFNRSQSVRTGTSASLPLFLSRGVPQGSILGPLLFSLYINDLPQHIHSCKTHMYADDVQLYTSTPIELLGEAVNRVNADLRSIWNWANANGLSLNPGKSKCLVVHSKSLNCTFDVNITINGHKIEVVSTVKNLGIIMNDTLTWSNQVNRVTSVIYAKLRTLWQTHYYTPPKIRVLIAKAYIMPSLLYGCEVFANCDSVSRNKLNTVFNNICRYVYGIGKYDHISQHSVKLYGITLDQLFKVRTLLLLHKIIYSKFPPYLFRRLTFTRSSRGMKLIPIRYKTLTSEWQFFINVMPLWNSLPHSIQKTSNITQFKTLLFNHFA